MAAPANDDFANAETLAGNSGTATATIDDATTEGGEPRGSAATNLAQTVWYTFTASREGLLVLDTLGSTTPNSGNAGPDGFLDTTLAVWSGATLGTLTELASNDDADGTTYTSKITVGVLAGETVSIQAGTFNTGYQGTIHLNYQFGDYDATVSGAVIGAISVGGEHVDTTTGWATTHPMTGTAGCTSDKKLMGISAGGAYANWTGVTSIFGAVPPPTFWSPWGDIANTAFKWSADSNEQFWGADEPANGTISTAGHIGWLDRDVTVGETFTWERRPTGITAGHWDVAAWYGVLVALDISPTPTEFPTPVPQGVESPDPNTTVATPSYGTGSSISTSYPSGRSQAFEWIFALVAWDNSAATFTGTDTAWTMIVNRTDAGSGTGVALYGRYVSRADSAPAFDGTFSTSVDWSVSMLAVRAPEATFSIFTGEGILAWQRF